MFFYFHRKYFCVKKLQDIILNPHAFRLVDNLIVADTQKRNHGYGAHVIKSFSRLIPCPATLRVPLFLSLFRRNVLYKIV